MTISQKIFDSEKLSYTKQIGIFIKTILMIPIAVLIHIFGAIIVIFIIPNTIHNMIYHSTKMKQIMTRGGK